MCRICGGGRVFVSRISFRSYDVTGDDYTLSVAICGFNDFGEIQGNYAKRNAYVADTYINQTTDVNAMWEIYKKEYSTYL